MVVKDILGRDIVFIQTPLHLMKLVKREVQGFLESQRGALDLVDPILATIFMEQFTDVGVGPEGDVIACLERPDSIGAQLRTLDLLELAPHEMRGHIVQFVGIQIVRFLDFLLDIEEDPSIHRDVIQGVLPEGRGVQRLGLVFASLGIEGRLSLLDLSQIVQPMTRARRMVSEAIALGGAGVSAIEVCRTLQEDVGSLLEILEIKAEDIVARDEIRISLFHDLSPGEQEVCFVFTLLDRDIMVQQGITDVFVLHIIFGSEDHDMAFIDIGAVGVEDRPDLDHGITLHDERLVLTIFQVCLD